MSISHLRGAQTVQDLIFRLGYDPNENSRERNVREHFNDFYEGAPIEARARALVVGAFVSPDLSRHTGTDVSHWDHNVNMAASKASGMDWTIIKAIDGTVPTNYWRANRDRAKAASYIHSSYGWLYPNNRVSCKLQAQAHFNLLKTNNAFGDLPEMIDWEWTYYAGVPANPNMQDLEMWVDEWLRFGGRKPLLYTARGYAVAYGVMPLALRSKFAGLVVANYGVTVPALPPGWTDYDIHQFTSSGQASIYSPNDANKLEVDLNYARDNTTIARLTGNVAPPPPSPTGDAMYTGTINSTQPNGNPLTQLSVRPKPYFPAVGDTTNNATDTIPAGTSILADALVLEAGTTRKWLHITNPVVGYANAAYITYHEIIPPVSGAPLRAVITMPDKTLWEATEFTKIG